MIEIMYRSVNFLSPTIKGQLTGILVYKNINKILPVL